MNALTRILLPGLLSFASGVLCAEPADALLEAPANGKAASPWRIGIALGYGERSNPLIQSDAVPIAVDVDVAWFGKHWFFDNGDLGFTVANNRSSTFSVIARANSDRVFFGKTNTRLVQVSATGAPLATPLQLVVPERSYAVELGVEWLADGLWGKLTIAGFADVSKAHDGFGVDAEYAYPVFGARWSIEPNITLRYKSTALNNYYWGVRASEANAALPAYSAGSGVNWQLGVRTNYYISSHLRLAASFNYERLSSTIVNSPLVQDRKVLGYFAGLAYQF
jgi:outer membrane protein